MIETIVVRAEDGLPLDLILWRRYGVRGRELITNGEIFAVNPGIAELGPLVPAGTEVVIPDLPAESRTPQKLVTLFPPKSSQ